MKKKYKIAIIALSLILAFACVMLAAELWDYHKDAKTFDNLSEAVNTVPPEIEDENVHRRDINSLNNINCDCVGWICIPGTAVDYPVMLTPDELQKYIRKNFYCESSSAGVPFIDGRCTTESDNIIIYGHNMKDGSMFAALKGYVSEAFYLQHTTLEFETLEGCREYRIIAVLNTTAGDSWFNFINAETDKAFSNAVSRLMKNSLYDTGVSVSPGDKFVTLSTCYGGDNGRLIVIAKECGG